jgi:hypothetical protein
MENLTKEKVKEGPVAKAIETQTAKLPSDLFLWTAAGFWISSLVLHYSGKKHPALMVGQCIAPLLIMGVYDKLVKQAGHDAKDKLSARPGTQH